MAGWLWDGAEGTPGRNDLGEGQLIRANESEDYHYDLWLDNDFIARNYGRGNLEPVQSATVRGARSRLVDLRPGREFPLLNQQQINAASFLWPGNGGLFTVELNAWHLADRGDPPPRLGRAGSRRSRQGRQRLAVSLDRAIGLVFVGDKAINPRV